MKISTLTLSAMTSAMLVIYAGHASAANAISGVSGYVDGVAGFHRFENSPSTGPAYYTTPSPLTGLANTGGPSTWSYNYGAASADQQTLRSVAQLSDLDYGSTSKTYSNFYKEVTVGAGTSGLSNGDSIRLNLNLHLDGLVTAGFIPPTAPGGPLAMAFPESYRMLSWADIYLSYRVVDMDQATTVCDGGCYTQYGVEVANFSHSGKLRYDDSSGSTLSWSKIYGWGYNTNVNGYVEGAYENSSDYLPSGPILPGAVSYSLDTGLLSLQIDTVVGHTLSFDSSLDVFLQAYGKNATASSRGDFGTTFDVDLTSTVAGIQLDGEVLGAYSPTAVVPVPAAAWLLGSGLVGLIGVARRRSVA